MRRALESVDEPTPKRIRIGSQHGTIEKVELVNFMCHSLLHCSFGPKINFIVGHNGSGKSAILTALMVCLGGKAAGTNRGSSISSLLKEGTNVGSVTVYLRNEGEDGYKTELYGKTIIVERKIVKNGSSTYKLKSFSGKTVSSRRDDLMAICDHHNIDVSNPMAILTQDTARMFLANSTAQDKYKFFLKGTQLEALRNDYATMDQLISNAEGMVKSKSDHLPVLESEVADLEAKLKSMETAHQLERKRDTLQQELVWAEVRKFEEDMEDNRKEGRASELKVVKAQEKVDDYKKQSETLAEQVADFQDKINDVQNFTGPLESRYNRLKSEIRAMEQERQEHGHELERNEAEHRANSKTLANLESRIRDEIQTHQLDRDEIRRGKLGELQRLSSEIERSKQESNHAQGSKAELDRDIEGAEEALSRENQAVGAIGRKLQEIDKSIQGARQQSSNRLTAFDHNMPALMNAIEEAARAGRWRARPIGPIGMHLKIKNQEYEKYANALEAIFGYNLNALCVGNQQDVQLLRQLMRKTQCNVTIMKYDSRRIDFSSGQPDEKFDTVYRILDIDNPIVLDQLIINLKIEKIVLVDHRREGDQLTQRGFPHNVHKVVTKDVQSVGSKNGGRNMESMTLWKKAPRLSKNIGSFIQDCERRKANELERHATHRNAIHRIKDDMERMKRQRSDYGMTISKCLRSIRQLEANMNEIQSSLEEEEPDRLLALETEKRELLEQMSMAKRQQELIEAKHDQVMESISESNVIYRKIQSELDVHQETINNYKQDFQTVSSELVKLNVNVDYYARKKGEYQAQHDRLMTEIHEAEQRLASQIKQISESYARVETNRSTEDIEDDIVQVTAHIAQSIEELGSMDDLLARLNVCQTEYFKLKAEVECIQGLVKYLTITVKERTKAYEEMQAAISLRSKRLFSEFVTKRGYRGVLDLDHVKKTLHLHVDVRQEDHDYSQSQVGRATDPNEVKALSGGEKSFATICLLLSLWDSMYSPFRALDEFDVFMDASNRQLAMQLMIDNAREANNTTQYLLITPQNMSKVKGMNGPDIRINKLTDPERGQTTLNFGTQPVQDED